MDAVVRRLDDSTTGITRLAHQLVLDLHSHFELEDARGALHDLAAAHCDEDVDKCHREQEAVLADARQLLVIAASEPHSAAWQRRLNRAFSRVLNRFFRLEGVERELVQHAYGLDIRDTD